MITFKLDCGIDVLLTKTSEFCEIRHNKATLRINTQFLESHPNSDMIELVEEYVELLTK